MHQLKITAVNFCLTHWPIILLFILQQSPFHDPHVVGRYLHVYQPLPASNCKHKTITANLTDSIVHHKKHATWIWHAPMHFWHDTRALSLQTTTPTHRICTRVVSFAYKIIRWRANCIFSPYCTTLTNIDFLINISDGVCVIHFSFIDPKITQNIVGRCAICIPRNCQYKFCKVTGHVVRW